MNNWTTSQIVDLLTAVINLFGFIGVIMTIVLLSKQNKEMVKQTRASVYQSITDQMLAIDQLFVRHPELKPYFYSNKPLPPTSSREYDQIMSMAEIIVDFTDNVITQEPNMLHYPWEETWHRYFQELIRTSFALQAYWERNKDWYADPLHQLFDRALGNPSNTEGKS